MRLDLESTVALVTGAAGGIGSAVVHCFRQAGVRVTALDLDPLAEKSGPDLLALQGDVTDSSFLEHAVESTRKAFGRIDSLVHCAGIIRDAVHWKLSDESWDQVLEVNLTSGFRLLRAVVPVMRSQGSGAIVMVSSINGIRGKFGQANYAASKGGLIALTKTAALEVGAFGIRVNAVAPGMVRTRMTADLPPSSMAQALDRSVLGRIAEPVDVAGPILFLCSPLARHITGTVLCVDGGQSIA